MKCFENLKVYELNAKNNHSLVVATSVDDAAEYANSSTNEVVVRDDLDYILGIVSIDDETEEIIFDIDKNVKATKQAGRIIRDRVDNAIIMQTTNNKGIER